MKVIINPLEGMLIEENLSDAISKAMPKICRNIKINLEMSKAKVAEILGKAECENGNRHFYFDNELAIDYDEMNTVEFIEFLGGINGILQPVIYGIPAFESDAGKLFEVLRLHNDGDVFDSENGYSYSFNKIGIRIYRTSTPESVQMDIEEMKADGVFDQNYIDEELQNANHWATIGVGRVGYYKK